MLEKDQKLLHNFKMEEPFFLYEDEDHKEKLENIIAKLNEYQKPIKPETFLLRNLMISAMRQETKKKPKKKKHVEKAPSFQKPKKHHEKKEVKKKHKPVEAPKKFHKPRMQAIPKPKLDPPPINLEVPKPNIGPDKKKDLEIPEPP